MAGSRLGSAARLSLVALVAWFALAPSPAHAAFPGANGKIAFASNQSGNYEVYVVNPDGTGIANLTSNPAFDLDSAWSPDGTKIAFASNRDKPDPTVIYRDIYVMNADGSGVTRVTNTPADNFAPEWSPDGTKIAFVSNQPDPCLTIFTVNPDGSAKSPIGCGEQPAWSPDGTRIAFSLGAEIGVMNADGSGRTIFDTGPSYVFKDSPDWSPDGAKIAFSKTQLGPGEEDCCADIYVMNPDGTSLTNVTNNPSGYGPWHNFPAWSPDGTKIALERVDDVYRMNADGSGMQFVAQGIVGSWGLRTDPDWQPLPTASYPHPQSASQLNVSLVPAFKPCGTGGNPSNAKHAPPLATNSCNPPRPSVLAAVGGSSQSSAQMSVTPGDTDPTNGNQANVTLSASLTDIQAVAGGDYNPNATGADLTAVTRLRFTDKANGYGGLPATATEYDFRVPIYCSSTSKHSIGSTCTTNTTANSLIPGLIQEQEQIVVQAFRVRIDDSGANGIRGDSDDRIFATQGFFVP
jgi:dipeptidyl aminopeptidase/acylaminoacyl peptidase